jgi:hypothetical protein
MFEGDDLSIRDQHRDAASGHHQDQSSDDRLNPDFGDEPAIRQAGQCG